MFVEALKILNLDKISNLSLIGVTENEYAFDIKIIGNSVWLKSQSDEIWNYINSQDKSELNEIINNLNETDKYFAAIDKWIIPFLCKERNIDWEFKVYQLHLPDNVSVKDNNLNIIRLNPSHAGVILETSKYKDILTLEYLNDRISKSFSAGILFNDELAGWGITHDDGAIGALNVIEKFRGKGYGKEIVTSLINENRKAGKIPFAQVEKTNLPALKLFSKLGFVIDKEESWLKLV